MAHLRLSEQFETIQNQARSEAMTLKMETAMQTVTLSEIITRDITPEI